MHDSFYSLDLRYVFERSLFVRVTFPLLVSSLGTNVVISCLSRGPKMWATTTLEKYIGFYTRLACVHVEPAQSTPSTAPPLLCETHPAQRSSITLL